MNDTGRVRLASWKEIAAYLRREVRTVIRWEKERGLPVHRLPGGRGGSVFAFADELDKWAAGEQGKDGPQPKPATRRRRILVFAGASALAAIAVAGAALAKVMPGDLADVQISGSTITGVDADGSAIWTSALNGHAQSLSRRQSQVIDLNGDRAADAVVTVLLSRTLSLSPTGMLYAFASDGKRLWERTISTGLSFGGDEFDGPWQSDDVLAFTNGGEPLVAWAVHHLTWWPSMLTVFDARGSRLGTYVQSGWIRLIRPSRDGRQLITAGFSNSRRGAAFAVLDSRRPDGSSPEEPGSSYACRNCPDGRPQKYFVVEWSDIATGLPPDERSINVIVHPETGAVVLHAIQRRGADLIVELSPSYEPVRRSASDAFWDWHTRLEQNGTLDHGRDRCPYRNGPVVHEWTPERGWRTIGS